MNLEEEAAGFTLEGPVGDVDSDSSASPWWGSVSGLLNDFCCSNAVVELYDPVCPWVGERRLEYRRRPDAADGREGASEHDERLGG